MQRRARTYVAGVALAVTLSGGLTACSDSPDGKGTDTKAGGSASTAPAAPPGKYQTLPEPCGAIDLDTLKDLLPGAETAGDGDGEASPSASPYEGEATVTYDTDRRVGCRWKSANSLGSRHLAVDLERVVSYDPAVSDDEQAELLYDQRAGQADIPTESVSPSPEEKKEKGEKDGKDEKDGDSPAGSEKPDSASAGPGDDPSGSSPSPDAELSPRMLDDIGDNAYIDDQLDTGDSGVHRDITIVFRSANVIATITYDQWLSDKRRIPDSAELQQKARSVAEELTAGFDDN
ncbi:MAG: hypothetical protein ACRDP3_12380 [Streptomyces sp.]|uniref:hypothetical protein n=1 Tax=Streptomyces sp. TaxID=1931 RepID=UPI003D6A5F27